MVTLDGTALNSTVWLTCYHTVNVTVPIPMSARNKASIKYEQNYSTAGTLLHSTSQVNHCTQQLTLKGSCSGAWDIHHLQKGWPQEIPISYLQSCTAAIGNGWWHTLTFLSCRSAGRRGFLLCALHNWVRFQQVSMTTLHDIQHQNWTRIQTLWLHLVKIHYSTRQTSWGLNSIRYQNWVYKIMNMHASLYLH